MSANLTPVRKRARKSNEWPAAIEAFFEKANTYTLLRARQCAANGRVVRVWIDEDGIQADVKGSEAEAYETSLKLNSKETGIQGDCSCPVHTDCKHMYAVAMVIARDGFIIGNWRPSKVVRALPPSWVDVKGRSFTVDGFKEFLAPQFDAIKGAKPTVSEKKSKQTAPWFRQFLKADNPEKQRSILEGAAIQLIGRGSSYYNYNWLAQDVSRTAMLAENPIKILAAFQAGIKRTSDTSRWKATVPDEALSEFLESQEAAELQGKFEKQLAEERFLHWLKPAGNQSAAYKWNEPVEPTIGFGRVSWSVEEAESGIGVIAARIYLDNGGKKGVVARAINGLPQLATEVSSGSRTYGHKMDEFLQWFGQWLQRTYHDLLVPTSNRTLFYVPDVFQWSAKWLRNLPVVWEDTGRPIELFPTPASLIISEQNGAKNPTWCIKLPDTVTTSDSQIQLTDATLVRDSGDTTQVFVRWNDSLVPLDTKGMSLKVLTSICYLGYLPLSRINDENMGYQLASRLFGGNLNTAVARQWVQEVACMPAVELLYAPEEQALTIIGRATSVGETKKPSDAQRWRYDFHGNWAAEEETRVISAIEDESALEDMANQDAPAASGNGNGAEPHVEDNGSVSNTPNAFCKVPRFADVEVVQAWLDQAALPGANAVRLQPPKAALRIKLDAPATEHLLRHWIMRPAKVEFLGNAAFRDLVTFRKPPRFGVKVEASDVDWLKVSVSVEGELEDLSFAEMQQLLSRNDDELLFLPRGRVYKRQDLDEYVRTVEMLGAMGVSALPGQHRLHALQLGGAKSLAPQLGPVPGLDKFLARARKVVDGFQGIPEAPIAEHTAGFLRPYQREGANFLVWAAQTFGGALLADDMGLGKTLQVLAALTAMREAATEGPRTTLVVCPTSVAHNWQREIQKFAPMLSVLVLESGKGRDAHYENLSDYDVVVTNYALLRRDLPQLVEQSFMCVVIDEAQAIKNPAADTARSIKQLESKYRFALTGTPIENRLSDLFSIMEFAVPGYLANMDSSAGPGADPKELALVQRALRGKLRPVLLRRLKSEVATELPERIETRSDCEMEGKQRKLYLAELKRARAAFNGIDDNAFRNTGRIQMLALLMRLRQICCDPVLINEPEVASAKVDHLMEVISPLLEAGHKVLLFSQFVTMLKHLETVLLAAQVKTYMLHGQTRKRQEVVETFESDKDASVFLISLKAGGTGLNLISASHVVLFDPWWNPAVEAQAIDRSHRIGQDKTVVAYRLVCTDTIEERILELQEKKRALVRGVLEEESFNRALTRADFQYLLS